MAYENLYNSSDIPDICTKCLIEKGTVHHCFWECHKIQKFWRDVIRHLSELFKVKVPLEVKICVLGIYPVEFKQSQTKTKLIDYGLLQAKRSVAWPHLPPVTARHCLLYIRKLIYYYDPRKTNVKI
uniref:Reverse transcriptase zinc-binding domain-containing protein n=1 Tax=Fundulus heteroclitus TaxID=8078 RepID=A0A3Q2QFJ0_FUNHE